MVIKATANCRMVSRARMINVIVAVGGPVLVRTSVAPPIM